MVHRLAISEPACEREDHARILERQISTVLASRCPDLGAHRIEVPFVHKSTELDEGSSSRHTRRKSSRYASPTTSNFFCRMALGNCWILEELITGLLAYNCQDQDHVVRCPAVAGCN